MAINFIANLCMASPAEFVLGVAVRHDRRLAQGLYPVCNYLADTVAQTCKLVTCTAARDLFLSMDHTIWTCMDIMLCSSRWAPRVNALRLTRDRMRPTSLYPSMRMYEVKAAEQLRVADLRVFISASKHFTQLRLLDISGSHTLTQAAQVNLRDMLADAAECWPQLTHLILDDLNLEITGAAVVAAAGLHWPHLQHLSLHFNNLGPQGLQMLAAAGQHWTELQNVRIWGNGISQQAVDALMQVVPHWEGKITG